MKTWTEEELFECERDPEKCRRYYMYMVMHWRRLAHKNRKKSRLMGQAYPVGGYRPVFDEGRDLMHEASVLDRMADAVGQYLNEFVASTVRVD